MAAGGDGEVSAVADREVSAVADREVGVVADGEVGVVADGDVGVAAVEAYVESLFAALDPADLPGRRLVEDVITALLVVYGTGWRRAAAIVAGRVTGSAPLAVWADDPVLDGVLRLHGIDPSVGADGVDHRADEAAAVRRAESTIDEGCDELAARSPDLAAVALDAMSAVADLHALALRRMVEAVATVDAAGATGAADGLVRALGDDDLVGSLLIAHGLHPVPFPERLSSVLAEVRSQRGAAADVEVVGVVGTSVHLRVSGAAPAAAWRFRLLVERVIGERLPDAASVVVEGGEEPTRPTATTIPLESLTVRRSDGSRTPLGTT